MLFSMWWARRGLRTVDGQLCSMLCKVARLHNLPADKWKRCMTQAALLPRLLGCPARRVSSLPRSARTAPLAIRHLQGSTTPSLAEDLQRRFGYRAALRRGRHREKRGKTRTELPWPRATSKCTAAGRGQNTVIFLVCSRGLTALPAA